MRTENTITIKKSANNNIGIYNILQKAKALKAEDRELENNPFYKIQKNRKNSKIFQFHSRKNK